MRFTHSKRSSCVAYVQRGLHSKFYCIRPYYVERTGSRPITEVKQRRAQSVLGWVTTLETGCRMRFTHSKRSSCVAYVQRGRHSKFYCIRPYYVERTGSRPITEVKRCRAQSVLGW